MLPRLNSLSNNQLNGQQLAVFQGNNEKNRRHLSTASIVWILCLDNIFSVIYTHWVVMSIIFLTEWLQVTKLEMLWSEGQTVTSPLVGQVTANSCSKKTLGFPLKA